MFDVITNGVNRFASMCGSTSAKKDRHTGYFDYF